MAALLAHQIATRAMRGAVSVVVFRDPADGSELHGVAYTSQGAHWLSDRRFIDPSHADAAADVLGEFLTGRSAR
jgi:hypothetical protein